MDNPTELKVVVVDWLDAVCTGGTEWQSSDEIQEAVDSGPSRVRSVGMLLHEDEHYIALTDTMILDGDAGGYVHVIPRGMVVALSIVYAE